MRPVDPSFTMSTTSSPRILSSPLGTPVSFISSRARSPTPSTFSEIGSRSPTPTPLPADVRQVSRTIKREQQTRWKQLVWIVLILAALGSLAYHFRHQAQHFLTPPRETIYAQRYSDEFKYKPALSPIITETLKDGRVRIRGATPTTQQAANAKASTEKTAEQRRIEIIERTNRARAQAERAGRDAAWRDAKAKEADFHARSQIPIPNEEL